MRDRRRTSELASINLADYHRSAPGAKAQLLVHNKGGDETWVGVPVAVDDWLAHRVSATVARPGEAGGRLEQPMFVTATGARVHEKHVSAVITRIVETFTPHPDKPPRERWKLNLLASIDGVAISAQLASLKGQATPHRFRHSYGTHGERQGVPIRQIQRDLNHASVATTEGYIDDGHIAELQVGEDREGTGA
ncbi:tyrosine-type recombinase/integrase [Saccharopolyspora sp. NPDC003752]